MRDTRLRMAMVLTISAALVAVSSMSGLADLTILRDGRPLAGQITTTESGDHGANIAWANVEYISLQQADCLHSAGERLSSFRTKFYIGWGLSALGTIVTVLAFDFSNPTSFGVNPVLSLIGGLLSLGGAILQLVSYWEIGSAGEALQQC